MKYINIILLFSLASVFLCISCNTRKKSVEKQQIVSVYDTLYKRDSIFITKDRVILLPTINSKVITNPCDESGKLNPINENIKFPYGTVEIKSDGNNLVAKVNTDSISSVFEKQYQERNEKQLHQISELEKENTILKVVPFNWWLVGCIASLVVNGILIFLYIKNKFI